MFRILVGERGELNREGIVAIAQLEMVAGKDGGIGNEIATRMRTSVDRLSVDGKGGKLYSSLPLSLDDILRTEPGNATRATKEDSSLVGSERGTIAELVAL